MIRNNFKDIMYKNNKLRDEDRFILDDKEHEELIEEIDYSKVDEKIYYNLSLYNDNTSTIPQDIRFDLRRNNEILDNPEQWEIGCENFSLDSYDIPILISLQNDTSYEIGIFDNFTLTEYLVNVDFYSANNNNINIRDYDIIVNATNEAFNNLGLQVGLPAPFILRDGSNFKLYVSGNVNTDVPSQGDYYYNWVKNDRLNQNNRYTVFFNFKLARLWNQITYIREQVGGITSSYVIDTQIRSGLDLIEWNEPNIVPPTNNFWLILDQQWDPRPSMIQWYKIIFLTDMPIKNELEGKSNDVTQAQVLDYIINDRILDKTKINYFPQYIKWNNMVNAQKLDQITIRAIIEDNAGNKYNLRLSGFGRFSMKLVFRKKKTLK
jgi:hypothetical protein